MIDTFHATGDALPKSLKRKRDTGAVDETMSEEPAPQRQSIDETSFRFMELPGELRNRVYEFAWQEEQRGRKVRLYRMSAKLITNDNYAASYPARQFFGLTQVNRDIRKEFRPLYLDTYRPEIFFRHLDKYLTVFQLKNENLSRKFRAIVHAVRTSSIQEPGIDILPLLRTDPFTLPFDMTFLEAVVLEYNTPLKVLEAMMRAGYCTGEVSKVQFVHMTAIENPRNMGSFVKLVAVQTPASAARGWELRIVIQNFIFDSGLRGSRPSVRVVGQYNGQTLNSKT